MVPPCLTPAGPRQRGSTQAELIKYITSAHTDADLDKKAFGVALKKAVTDGVVKLLRGRYLLATTASPSGSHVSDKENDAACDAGIDGSVSSDAGAEEAKMDTPEGAVADVATATGEVVAENGDQSPATADATSQHDDGGAETQMEAALRDAITALRKVCHGSAWGGVMCLGQCGGAAVGSLLGVAGHYHLETSFRGCVGTRRLAATPSLLPPTAALGCQSRCHDVCVAALAASTCRACASRRRRRRR